MIKILFCLVTVIKFLLKKMAKAFCNTLAMKQEISPALIGYYTFKIIYAIYPFLLTIPQLFPDTFRQECNNLPGKRPHIEALREIPGIRCIYREQYNKCQQKLAYFFVKHP